MNISQATPIDLEVANIFKSGIWHSEFNVHISIDGQGSLIRMIGNNDAFSSPKFIRLSNNNSSNAQDPISKMRG